MDVGASFVALVTDEIRERLKRKAKGRRGSMRPGMIVRSYSTVIDNVRYGCYLTAGTLCWDPDSPGTIYKKAPRWEFWSRTL